MNILNELNAKAYELRKEKADITAEISEIQCRRSAKGANTAALDQEKAELIADAADVDRELTVLSAQIKYLAAPTQERDKRVDAIRLLVAALLTSNKPLTSYAKVVNTAIDLEDQIQSRIPQPVMPTIELED